MRIANRVRLGGHNIENTDVYRRVGRSLDNLKKISGNVDRMYVLDNTEMPFRTIIINKNKVNTFVSKNIPDWTGSLLEKLTINEYKSKIKLLSPETKSMLLKNLEKKTEPKKDSGMER